MRTISDMSVPLASARAVSGTWLLRQMTRPQSKMPESLTFHAIQPTDRHQQFGSSMRCTGQEAARRLTHKLCPEGPEAGLDEGEPQDVVGDAREPEALHMAQLLGKADDEGLGYEVDRERHGRPPADDDGEDAGPDGQQGDDHEGWGGEGTHHICPHATAVQDAHAEGEASVEEGAVFAGQHDLEVTLQQGTGQVLQPGMSPYILSV